MPYEFHPADSIPAREAIEYAPPPGFRRAHPGIAPGTWSDDGAQALCLLASLLYFNALDVGDFSRRLVNWYEHGYMAVDNLVFDVGAQTSQSIRALIEGTPPLEAGGTDEYSKGNGSLMRVLPLALWHEGDDAALAADAHDQSRPTHGHVTVQACCALYCLWARRILEGASDPWTAAVDSLRRVYIGHPAHGDALDYDICRDGVRTPRGSGYVIDCLFSAKHALEAGPYEEVVRAAIALGKDTDTTACVAGGLAGLRDGIATIPQRWRDGLRGRETLEPLLAALLARGP